LGDGAADRVDRRMSDTDAKEPAVMSQPTKPTSATETQSKKQPTDTALPEAELDKVSGGKVQLHDLNITKVVDKSSPSLG
jgi:type VI protein secretion system component Hcp